MRIKCYSIPLVLLLVTFVSCCSVLLYGLLGKSPEASAISPNPNSYQARYTTYNDATQTWHSVNQNQVFHPYYMYDYEWIIDSVTFQGNYTTIHFETNLVIAGNSNMFSAYLYSLNHLTINYCGSQGTSYPVKSQNVSYVVTNWNQNNTNSPSGALPGKRQTLTVFGDVVVSGTTSGTTSDLYCGVGTDNNWAFLTTNVDWGNNASVYFEQQPTNISFSNDESEALQRATLNALNNIDQSIQDGASDIVDAINNQSNEEQEKYEEQSQQVQDDLEDESEASEQQGATLIAMLTQFWTAIRDVDPTSSCIIYFDLRRYSGGFRNNINLCDSHVLNFLTYRATPSPLSGLTSTSIWSLISTVVFSCIIIALLLPTLNLIKRTYEELRK